MDETPKIDLQTVEAFLTTDEAGKKWLQSRTDSTVTKGIDTWREKSMPAIIEQEIAKRYPAETPEQKQLRQLQQDLANMQAANLKESLRNKALTYATQKGLPLDLVDYFVGQDEDTTTKALDLFGEKLQGAVEAAVDGKFKEAGRVPPRSPKDPGTGLLSPEELAKLPTPEKVAYMNKHRDEYATAMAKGAYNRKK